jgi:hypothetical protein
MYVLVFGDLATGIERIEGPFYSEKSALEAKKGTWPRTLAKIVPIATEGDKDRVYHLCEAVADIAYAAGHDRLWCEDSRALMSTLIGWAYEFETTHANREWDGEYIEEIDAHYDRKRTESDLAPDGGGAWPTDPARVLITVSGGVADYRYDGNVVVDILDFDNLEAGDTWKPSSPEFARLAEMAGYPDPLQVSP